VIAENQGKAGGHPGCLSGWLAALSVVRLGPLVQFSDILLLPRVFVQLRLRMPQFGAAYPGIKPCSAARWPDNVQLPFGIWQRPSLAAISSNSMGSDRPCAPVIANIDSARACVLQIRVLVFPELPERLSERQTVEPRRRLSAIRMTNPNLFVSDLRPHNTKRQFSWGPAARRYIEQTMTAANRAADLRSSRNGLENTEDR
jgi:hypothetical protein